MKIFTALKYIKNGLEVMNTNQGFTLKSFNNKIIKIDKGEIIPFNISLNDESDYRIISSKNNFINLKDIVPIVNLNKRS